MSAKGFCCDESGEAVDIAGVTTQTTVMVPRCWADIPSILDKGQATECQALGMGPLGLCLKHADEILLNHVPPEPYVRSRWEVK